MRRRVPRSSVRLPPLGQGFSCPPTGGFLLCNDDPLGSPRFRSPGWAGERCGGDSQMVASNAKTRVRSPVNHSPHARYGGGGGGRDADHPPESAKGPFLIQRRNVVIAIKDAV